MSGALKPSMRAAKDDPLRTMCGNGEGAQPYEVHTASARVEKQLDAVPDTHFDAVAAAIRALAGNPRPLGCRKLTGRAYRIRVGPFRVVYSVHDGSRRVVVDKVVRRSERTYRRS